MKPFSSQNLGKQQANDRLFKLNVPAMGRTRARSGSAYCRYRRLVPFALTVVTLLWRILFRDPYDLASRAAGAGSSDRAAYAAYDFTSPDLTGNRVWLPAGEDWGDYHAGQRRGRGI